MRILLFIFLTVICVGCSSNQVTVTMRDGAKIESELLSVRDSSILIQEKGGAPIVIRNTDVHHVFIDGGSPAPAMVGIGLGGSILGLLTGVTIFGGCEDCGGPTQPGPYILLTTFIGAVAGVTTGYFVSPSDKMFFLSNPGQRYDLTFYAKYDFDTEPDELKKIK